MPSKHTAHIDLISKRLTDGWSLVAICKDLEKIGLNTTPQGLNQWLKRRSIKIAAAKTMIDPDPSLLVVQTSQVAARKRTVPNKPALATAAASAPPAPPAAVKLPDLVRSSSVVKPEPSDLEKRLASLAAQAGQTPANNWKTK